MQGGSGGGEGDSEGEVCCGQGICFAHQYTVRTLLFAGT